tara:strand:+ start:363 stop:662 length:300 start_codon:yes stop_codon:yes gene_type:complete
MTSHKDKARAPGLSAQGKANHEAIFGPPKGTKRTPEEQERYEQSRRDHHAKLAEDGKKPADWYLTNERRVPQDPTNYVKRPRVSEEYKVGWDDIFGGIE